MDTAKSRRLPKDACGNKREKICKICCESWYFTDIDIDVFT